MSNQITILGARHSEEARVYDSYEGYHRFHAEETQEPYGSFEVFWWEGGHMLEQDEDDTMPLDDWREPEGAGWYWRAAFPGCLPDGTFRIVAGSTRRCRRVVTRVRRLTPTDETVVVPGRNAFGRLGKPN